MNQKGFAPVILLVILGVLVLIGMGFILRHSSLLNSNRLVTGGINSNNVSLSVKPSSVSVIQPSNPSSLPKSIQKSAIFYIDNTNIYLLNGLTSQPVLLDQFDQNGAFPQFSPDRSKLAYEGTAGDINTVMIYDIASSKKSEFIKEPQGCGVGGISWSPGGNYLLVSEHCGGSDTSSGTVYTYPSGKALITIPGLEGYRNVSAEWADNNTLIYTDPLSDTNQLNFNERCIGTGYATQITKITFSSNQKQVLIPATTVSDYSLEEVDGGSLYYEESDWKDKSCTSGIPVDTYMKANLDGTDPQKIDKNELPSAKADAQALLMNAQVLSMLGTKYSHDTVGGIQQNAEDSNWILFTISTPSSQNSSGNNAQTYTMAVMNLKDPSHTFTPLGPGGDSVW